MVEGGNLLNGDLAAAGFVDCRADNTVRALADDIKNLILSAFTRNILSTMTETSAQEVAHRR